MFFCKKILGPPRLHLHKRAAVPLFPWVNWLHCNTWQLIAHQLILSNIIINTRFKSICSQSWLKLSSLSQVKAGNSMSQYETTFFAERITCPWSRILYPSGDTLTLTKHFWWETAKLMCSLEMHFLALEGRALLGLWKYYNTVKSQHEGTERFYCLVTTAGKRYLELHLK